MGASSKQLEHLQNLCQYKIVSLWNTLILLHFQEESTIQEKELHIEKKELAKLQHRAKDVKPRVGALYTLSSYHSAVKIKNIFLNT